MVSLSHSTSLLGTAALQGAVRGAIDMDLKGLLEGPEDSFGCASLLWSLVRNEAQIANMSGLVGWSLSFARTTLIDGIVGRKRDEIVTAAILIVATLELGRVLSRAEAGKLRAAAQRLLRSEFLPGQVPFGSSCYGAALIYSAQVLRLDLPGRDETAFALVGRFTGGAHPGRPLGLGFLAACFVEDAGHANLRRLYDYAVEALQHEGLQYENQLYLAHAAFIAGQALGDHALLIVAPLVEKTLANLPSRAALEVAELEVEAAAPKAESARLSRLYLAMLHDLVAGYARRERQLEKRRIEVKYQGDRGLHALAFLGIVIPMVVLAALVVRFSWPFALQTLHLYSLALVNPVQAVGSWDAPVITLGSSYVLVVALAVIRSAWEVVFKRAVASDAYVWAEVLASVGRAVWRWTLWLPGTTAAGVLGNLAYAALQSQLMHH